MIEEKISGIYCIENNVNLKRYIGQSKNIFARWRMHKSALKNNRHKNSHLQNAWNKYGEDSFNFIILEKCDVDKIDELERFYIKKYSSIDNRSGYNHESGGNLNKKASEETKKKISKNHADVSKENNPFYNKKHTKESIGKYMTHPNYINRKHKGTDSHLCTITEDIAREIKKHFSDGHEIYRGEITDIAKKYDTSIGIVSHIKNGYAWAWL